MREERAEDDLGAFRDRLLGRLLRAGGAAGVVLDQELKVRIAEFGERQLGGIAHRLRREPRIAARRKRQNESDLDLACPECGPGLSGWGRRRTAPEIAARKSRTTRGERGKRQR